MGTENEESFPQRNFLINKFSSHYRLERDSKGGRIMLHAREDVPSNSLVFGNKFIETLYAEINLQNVIILISCS